MIPLLELLLADMQQRALTVGPSESLAEGENHAGVRPVDHVGRRETSIIVHQAPIVRIIVLVLTNVEIEGPAIHSRKGIDGTDRLHDRVICHTIQCQPKPDRYDQYQNVNRGNVFIIRFSNR